MGTKQKENAIKIADGILELSIAFKLAKNLVHLQNAFKIATTICI